MSHAPILSTEQAQRSANQLLRQLASAIPNYQHRQGQQMMLNCVAEQISQSRTAAIQAGTGTGKTFAYLLGALPFLLENDKRLLIATHTISLQQQLIEKDLPHLQQLLPQLRIEIAKGGNRYFCPQRAHQLLSKTEASSHAEQAQVDLFDEPLPQDKSERILAVAERLFNAHQTQNFSGDLDKIDFDVNQQDLQLINRHPARCAGKNSCDFKDACPYYIQREKISKAHIVITNQKQLAINSIQGLSLFGECSNELLIIDEAHHFADVFRQTLESSFACESSLKLGDKLDKVDELLAYIYQNIANAAHYLAKASVEPCYQRCQSAFTEQHDHLWQLNEFLRQHFKQLRGEPKDKFDDPNTWLMNLGLLPAPFVQIMQQLLVSSEQAKTHLTQLNKLYQNAFDDLFKQAKNKNQQRSLVQGKNLLSELQTMLAGICHTLKHFLEHEQQLNPQVRQQLAIARWITREPHQGEFHLHANPLPIQSQLENLVHRQFMSCLYTSATLEALGSPVYSLEQLGLNRGDYHHMPSPLNYQAMTLQTPLINRCKDHHSKTFVPLLSEQIQQARQRHQAILVLFTSKEKLNKTYQAYPASLQKQILNAEKMSKQALIEQHLANIDAGKPSILFGCDSLGEGLDLQGKYLTCVMITNFPFAHLGDPINAYKKCLIEAAGQNAFSKMALPACSQKLIQWTGRLIRSESDFGEVIICDPKANAPYAHQLITSLPKFETHYSGRAHA